MKLHPDTIQDAPILFLGGLFCIDGLLTISWTHDYEPLFFVGMLLIATLLFRVSCEIRRIRQLAERGHR